VNKFDLLKSHIDQFTRSDGTVVAAHDDKRVKASPNPAAKPATSGFVPPKDEYKYYGPDEQPGDFHGRMKAYHEMLASGAKNEIAKKGHEMHAAYHGAGQAHYASVKPYDGPSSGLSASEALRHPDHRAVVAAASRGEFNMQHAAEKHALGKDISLNFGEHGRAAKKLLDSMDKKEVAAASRGEMDMQHEAEKAALGKK